jgi:hypothetical protein
VARARPSAPAAAQIRPPAPGRPAARSRTGMPRDAVLHRHARSRPPQGGEPWDAEGHQARCLAQLAQLANAAAAPASLPA